MNKGYALHQMKQYQDAITVFDRVIALEPNNTAALLNKGYDQIAVGITLDLLRPMIVFSQLNLITAKPPL